MRPHSDTEGKTQVDAEVLSERSLSCHYLGHRPQAERLRANNKQGRVTDEDHREGDAHRQTNEGETLQQATH